MTSPPRRSPPSTASRLPTPTRDHRGALAALALLLVVAGALGSALVAYRSGHRVDVLVTNTTIPPGHKMSASDFGVARVATDSGGVVEARAKDNFVGTFATGRIPAGTLVNRTMFRVGGVVPDGAVVVGVTLTNEQRPSGVLAAGDIVRVYLVPKSGQQGASQSAGQVLVRAARVVDVQPAASAQSATTASLLLSAADAQTVVPAATQAQVAVALLPAGTIPSTDFQTS